eukprot:1400449-Alexandrium_andersonii.AAC.1
MARLDWAFEPCLLTLLISTTASCDGICALMVSAATCGAPRMSHPSLLPTGEKRVSSPARPNAPNHFAT